MNLKALHAKLEYEYRQQPSKARLLRHALQAVQDGLQVLASAGHQFHLAEGASPPQQWDWPRTYYHYDLGHREVLGPGDLAELGPGWYPSLGEAEQAHGEDVQFAGRGGVIRRRQVAQVNGASAQFVPIGPAKADLIAKFRSGRVDLGPIKSDSKVENSR